MRRLLAVVGHLPVLAALVCVVVAAWWVSVPLGLIVAVVAALLVEHWAKSGRR